MLDVVFALDRRLNIFVMLEVDEPLDRIPLRKSRDQAIPVFIDSTNKVVRNSNVQNAVGGTRAVST
jgi:hypothetical protein